MLFCLLAVALMAKAQDFVLTVADVSIKQGDKAVTVNIETSSAENVDLYSAYQFDLVIPECLSVPYNEEEETYAYYDEEEEDFIRCFSSLINKDSHSINVKQQSDGSWRVLTYSGSNANFRSNKGNVVLTLNALIKDGTKPGRYPIYIKESSALFATSKAAAEDGSEAVRPSLEAGTLFVSAVITYELKADYGTLILPFAADLPDGLKAYSCAEVEGNVLTLVEAESLAANTPYIMGGAKGSYAFTGAPIPSDATLTAGLLTGVLEDTDAPAGSYVLQNNTNGLGFYKVGSVIPTVKAYRCYLTYAGEASALMYRFGGTTNISNIEAEGNNAMYDILGRKVVGPAQKGVYILNGKKVFVK